MKKKKNYLQVRELFGKIEEITDRISDIADVCEKEQRERNEKENAEYETLVREKNLYRMRLEAMNSPLMEQSAEERAKQADAIIRENMHNGKQTQVVFMRDLIMVGDIEGSGIVPVKVQDIIAPLTEGLILDKLSLPFLTGLSGDYIWPTYEVAEASIMGEGVALTDTKINISKLTAAPQRIGIAIPMTRQSIDQSEGVLESIVKKVMPQSVTMLLNKILFSTDKVSGASTLVGPFVGKKASAVAFKATPTFLDFNSLKASVLATGVDGEHLCWVMTKAQKAIAEATPKDAGSGIMVCENDRIAGLPVFTTNYIGEGYIGLGDWRYQPMGLFGDMSFVIDPYSQARKDAVDFILNANYGTVTLKDEAFALAKVSSK